MNDYTDFTVPMTMS